MKKSFFTAQRRRKAEPVVFLPFSCIGFWAERVYLFTFPTTTSPDDQGQDHNNPGHPPTQAPLPSAGSFCSAGGGMFGFYIILAFSFTHPQYHCWRHYIWSSFPWPWAAIFSILTLNKSWAGHVCSSELYADLLIFIWKEELSRNQTILHEINSTIKRGTLYGVRSSWVPMEEFPQQIHTCILHGFTCQNKVSGLSDFQFIDM